MKTSFNKMKSGIILVFLVACASAKLLDEKVQQFSAYDFLAKYAVPYADRIRKAEDESLSGRSSRIAGGLPAEEGQFPYQAGIIARIGSLGSVGVCGGSLVSANRVLTAARCWWDGRNQANLFTVVLGSNLLFSGGERINTTDVVTHPLWIPSLSLNDIAMIRLPEPVELSATISLIRLPQGFDIFENFFLYQATASGFGVTKDGGEVSSSQYLSYVNMTVISTDFCNIAHLGGIHNSNLCTNTAGGSSTCDSDSGSPLVVMRNGNPLLIGVASYYSSLGCEAGIPAVFSRVTSFLSFINSNL